MMMVIMMALIVMVMRMMSFTRKMDRTHKVVYLSQMKCKYVISQRVRRKYLGAVEWVRL